MARRTDRPHGTEPPEGFPTVRVEPTRRASKGGSGLGAEGDTPTPSPPPHTQQAGPPSGRLGAFERSDFRSEPAGSSRGACRPAPFPAEGKTFFRRLPAFPAPLSPPAALRPSPPQAPTCGPNAPRGRGGRDTDLPTSEQLLPSCATAPTAAPPRPVGRETEGGSPGRLRWLPQPRSLSQPRAQAWRAVARSSAGPADGPLAASAQRVRDRGGSAAGRDSAAPALSAAPARGTEPPLTWAGRPVVRAGASRALSRASRRSSVCLLRPLRRRRCTAAARLPRLPDELREGSRAPAAAGWAGGAGRGGAALACRRLLGSCRRRRAALRAAGRPRPPPPPPPPPPSASAIATHRKAAHPPRGETRVAEAAPSAPAPPSGHLRLARQRGRGSGAGLLARPAAGRGRGKPEGAEARRGRRCGAPPPLLGQHLPRLLSADKPSRPSAPRAPPPPPKLPELTSSAKGRPPPTPGRALGSLEQERGSFRHASPSAAEELADGRRKSPCLLQSGGRGCCRPRSSWEARRRRARGAPLWPLTQTRQPSVRAKGRGGWGRLKTTRRPCGPPRFAPVN